MANIISISQSALLAAQAGLATTGHNIANASTPGYNRQVVVQGSAGGQNLGGGFVGKGTQIVDVKRIYNEYLSTQVNTHQSSKGQLDSHYTQIKSIDNMVADPAAGLTPAIEDFFKSVQNLVANPANLNGAPARQALVSAAESLSARFQSMDSHFRELRENVNREISQSVSEINSYAVQISDLNEAISKAKAADGKLANDLLDQRDYLVGELSKQTKVQVVSQNDSYNVFIGDGQPLVVGINVYKLAAMASPTDASQMEVAHIPTGGDPVLLAEGALTGGRLGGLFDFRSKTLDPVQNALGRVAVGMAQTFNAQHRLGQDQNGAMGEDFFKAAAPLVNASENNRGTLKVAAAIENVGGLTASDYRLAYDEGKYTITRLSDNKQLYKDSVFPPNVIDGIRFTQAAGLPTAGDNFLIKPTINGAAQFEVQLTDKTKIAAAAAIVTATAEGNSGTGTITPGVIDTPAGAAAVKPGFTLTYNAPGSGAPAVGAIVKNGNASVSAAINDKAALTGSDYRLGFNSGKYTITRLSDNATVHTGASMPAGPIDGLDFSIASGSMQAGDSFMIGTRTVSGFPAGQPVTVTNNGIATTYAPGQPIGYAAGATISIGGASFALSGAPADGDRFKVGPNTNGAGDSRNMLLLGGLQSKNTLEGGTVSYNGAYAQLVSLVGNKTHELDVNRTAHGKLLSNAVQAQQSESGVNLDEEAANLIRYQQAYQAAGKVMQTVSQLFDVLINIRQ
jgi:flagellar hook-associated protein 1 FlgK